MDRKLIARYCVRDIMGIVGMAVALFWSAGRIDWWPAWAAIDVMSTWIVGIGIVIFCFNPDLLVERLGSRKGIRPWDTTIVSTINLTTLVRYVSAGLDQRYGGRAAFLWLPRSPR